MLWNTRQTAVFNGYTISIAIIKQATKYKLKDIFLIQSIAHLKKRSTFASHLRKTISKCLPVPWMSGLVSGLQNRVRRFESARNLNFTEKINCYGSLDEWLSQRSAKPCTAVRIRQEPQTTSNALLAQLVEQLTLNQWVQGSNPWGCTRKRECLTWHSLFFVFINWFL